AEEVGRSVQVRAECDPFFGHPAQFAQAKDLESTRVGENGPPPRHEPVQPAQLANRLNSGPQVKVIGIAENDLRSESLKNVLGNTLHRSNRAHGHKDRGLDRGVRRNQSPSASSTAGFVDRKLERHEWTILPSLPRSGSVMDERQ